ncbi:MAG TPA: hypothetical protein VMD76_03105, partial [Candidatus Sulfotelmatobacter sp.]|nr:hypothetical protein [Candidatus Sulfotelmatobacter sp.]
MSRKINAVVGLVLLMCLWTGCGSSSSPPSSSSSGSGTPPVVAITANTGATQSTAAGTPFPSPLSVTVTLDGSGMSGEIVTFTAPSSGASGTFANGTTTDVELTNAQGLATAAPLMANPTGGSYTVTAAVKNTSATTSFSLTNVSATFFSFYLSGQESATYAYYALAGSVVIDAAGNVWAGEQDYNDGGNGLSSPEPAGDQITGGSLTFPAGAPAGQGTLTLNTTNLNLGPNGNGVEVFAVQFVNSSHALISQFDGLDTSSGSLDAQTLPSTPNGNFAFAMSGSDSSGDAVDF